MNLFELTGNALALQEMLESGEIDEQTFTDTLESLNIDGKIEAVIHVIKNLEAKAEACKKVKDEFAAKQKAAENGVQRLKDNLLTYLQATEQKKLEAGLFTVSRSSSESCEIIFEDMIPDDYMIPQPPKIDKAGIKKAIKNGEEIAGAKLIKTEHVRIK